MASPVNIRSPRSTLSPFNDDFASESASNVTAPGTGAAGIGTPAVGTPDLRALRATYAGTPPPPNIPPRGTAAFALAGAATPLPKPASSASLAIPATSLRPSSSPHVIGGISATRQQLQQLAPPPLPEPVPILNMDDLPIEEKVQVLGRHLNELRAKPGVSSSEEAGVESAGNSRSTPASIRSRASEVAGSRTSSNTPPPVQEGHPQREDSDPFPIHFHAPGADTTHPIYKWHSDQRRQVARARAASFAGPSTTPHPAFEHIHEPGGFRRNYVKLRAEEQGTEEPQMLNNFIDFLLLFGHFAGEDLEEDEEEDKDEEVGAAGIEGVPEAATEATPLLRASTVSRSLSRSRRRRGSVSGQGTATVTQAVLMLLKSFIGTGVLFLGKAFYNGGLVFSSIMFIFITFISLYSFLLLIKTKFVTSGSFGEIGGKLYGPWMRSLILGSIVISQLGFVATYTIFVAENLQSFVLGVTNCKTLIPVQYFILMELVFFLPLALVRDLTKLSSTALIADGFIFLGLLYIFGSEFSILANRGIADVKLFNPWDFPLFIGTAVFTFEGIGLIVPIADAMKQPHKLPMALSGVMVFCLFLFGGAGVLAYLTFGSDIQTVVLVNLDSHSKMVQSVQFLYALAILLSVPLQLFPAVRILENGLFTRSGKRNTRVKWTKNTFRGALVLFTSVVSSWGAADLDKFVAFVGCFACVPLCYVYPAMLHYRACARTRGDKLKDIAMATLGVFAFLYTSVQTIRLMVEPTVPKNSPLGLCKDRP